MRSRPALIALLVALALLPAAACRRDAAAVPPAAPPVPVPPNVQPAAPPGGEIAPSHQFYGVYISDQKAGFAEEWLRPLPGGGAELETKVTIEIQRLGQRLKLSLSDRVRYSGGSTGEIAEFETTESMGEGGETVRTGQRTESGFDVTINAAGSVSKKTLPFPKERAHDVLGPYLVARLRGAKAPVETWQFDRSTLQDNSVSMRVANERTMTIQGVKTTVLDIVGTDAKRGLELGSRMTLEGRALEMTVGPGFKLVLEDEAVAKNPAVQVPDLYRLGVVPADRSLSPADSVRRLGVKLEGPPPTLNVDDERQARLDRSSQLTIRSVACADGAPSELSAADRAKYLESTPFIDHEHAAVRAVLASEAPGADLAERLTRRVHRALRYTLATAPLSASAILTGGSGDCTEYARALVALLRASEIPAREVSGMAYSGDGEPGFAFHAWTEAWIGGRWCSLDPTWDQTTLDATHIALSRDDPTAIVGLLGGVKATILEVERR